MAIDDALRILTADYWEPVWRELTAGQRYKLTTAVAELIRAEPDTDEFDTAVRGVLDVLRGALPDTHPVLEAISETFRWASSPVDWRPVIAGLSARIAIVTRDDVRERLSGCPALTADQLRSAGADPADAQLIRLESGSGGFRFPAFQFDWAGRPIATVLAVNERLGADDDPWGAADWWLGDNAWLDAVPADLLGRRDDLLMAAVDAVTWPDW